MNKLFLITLTTLSLSNNTLGNNGISIAPATHPAPLITSPSMTANESALAAATLLGYGITLNILAIICGFNAIRKFRDMPINDLEKIVVALRGITPPEDREKLNKTNNLEARLYLLGAFVFGLFGVFSLTAGNTIATAASHR